MSKKSIVSEFFNFESLEKTKNLNTDVFKFGFYARFRAVEIIDCTVKCIRKFSKIKTQFASSGFEFRLKNISRWVFHSMLPAIESLLEIKLTVTSDSRLLTLLLGIATLEHSELGP